MYGRLKMMRRPFHYCLILLITLLLAGMYQSSHASEWFPIKHPRVITNIAHVALPCNKHGINGCLTPLKDGTWEAQIRRGMTPECMLHTTQHELKHATHDHDPRSGHFMTDDGNGNLMECGK